MGLLNRLKTVSHASHCADHFPCCAQFYAHGLRRICASTIRPLPRWLYLISNLVLESPRIPCYIEQSSYLPLTIYMGCGVTDYGPINPKF